MEHGAAASAHTPATARRLSANALALYVLHGSNLLIPLVTFPYIVRVIGLERFGALAFAAAVVQLGVVVTEFSFNMTATRQISLTSSDLRRVERTFNVVLTLKLLLAMACGAVLAAVVAAIPRMREDWVLYAALSPFLLGEALFPLWLFHGLQRMGYVAGLAVLGRALTLPILFVFVKDAGDDWLAALTQSLPMLLAGLVSMFIVTRRLGIRYRLPRNWEAYGAMLRDAWTVFVGRIGGHVYVRGPLLLLGFLVGATALGAFAVAHRVMGLLGGFVAPAAQTIYPHASQVFASSRQRFATLQKRVWMAGISFTCLALLAVNLLALPLTELLTGEPNPTVAMLILALSPAVFFTAQNSLLNVFVMARGQYVAMSRVLLLGMLVFVVASYPLTKLVGVAGMALTMTIVEAAVFLGCLLLVRGARSRASASS